MATLHLLRERPDTTAMVVGTNLMTVGALNVLRATGIAVLGDVSLDDPFWSQLVHPALTSFAQPVRNMAQSSIDPLLERTRRERATAKHIAYQFELRERDSVRSLIQASRSGKDIDRLGERGEHCMNDSTQSLPRVGQHVKGRPTDGTV